MIYIVIYENGNVIHDFSKPSLIFLLTENNILAVVSEGKCCPNSVLCPVSNRRNCQFGSTIIMYVCPYACVIYFGKSAGGAWSESAHRLLISLTLCLHLPCDRKNHSFWIEQCVCPQPSQAATFGISVLVRKFGGITDSNQNQKCACSNYPYKQLK